MIAKTRNLFVGLATEDVILVAWGLVSDHRETEAYSQCMDEIMSTVGGTLHVPDVPDTPPDPAADWVEFSLSGCEDANGRGLVVTMFGLFAFVATTVIWWLLRRSAGSRAGQE